MIVALSALWGLSPSFGKAIGGLGVGPFALVFWQSGLAAVILLVVCVVRGVSLRIGAQHLKFFAVIGICCVGLAYANLIFVTQQISAGFMAIVIVLSPLLTYVIALAIRIERFVAVRAVGVVVGLVGAALLVLPEGSLPSADLIPLALLSFLTPLGFAVANIYAETGRPEKTDNLVLAMGTSVGAALVGLVGALLFGNFFPLWQNPGEAAWLTVAFAVSSAAATMLFFAIVVRAGPVFLGQVGYLVALVGIVYGMWFFGETYSGWLWFAGALSFAGVAMVNMGKPGAVRPAPEDD